MNKCLRSFLATGIILLLSVILAGCGTTQHSSTVNTDEVTAADKATTIIDAQEKTPTKGETGEMSFKVQFTDPSDGPKTTGKAVAAAVTVSGGSSGGGGSAMTTINYPLEYRKRIGQINLNLVEKSTGNWKYSFPITVVNGSAVVQIKGLEVNTYTVMLDAGTTDMRVMLMHGEGVTEITSGKKATLRIVMEVKPEIWTNFEVSGVPGNFNGMTSVEIQASSKTANGDEMPSNYGYYNEGKLIVQAYVQLFPEPAVSTEYRVKDRDGKIFIQKISYNILTLLDNLAANGYQAVNYEASTDLEVEIVWPDQIKWSDLFSHATAFDTVSRPESIAIADVNNDGSNDVIVVTGYGSTESNLLKVYQNDGKGNFSLNASYPVNGMPHSLAIGDLNNDGKIDAVVATGIGLDFFYNTSGAFAPAGRYLIETAENQVVRIADVNKDNRLDVICIGWATDKLEIYTQGLPGSGGTSFSGSGPFSKTTYAVPHAGYEDLAIGDVNGDTLADIIVMSGQGMENGINIMLQTASGFGESTHMQFEMPHGLAIGDVNNDGLNEVIVTSGGNRPSATLNIVHVSQWGNWYETKESYDIPTSVRIADFNGDGRNDIAVFHNGWNAAGIYLQQSNSILAQEQRYGAVTNHWGMDTMAAGDINGDGKPDLAVLNYTNDFSIIYSH